MAALGFAVIEQVPLALQSTVGALIPLLVTSVPRFVGAACAFCRVSVVHLLCGRQEGLVRR